jgi:NADH-quinone oxidoreductase subunit G
MDDFATQTVTYETGAAASWLSGIEKTDIGKLLADATNLVIVAGAEGLTLEGSRALMQAAANFLVKTGHVGKANNGLMSPLPGSNGMGLYYTGFTPENTQDIMQNPPQILIVAQADVLADDPNAAEWLNKVTTVINLSLFEDTLSSRAAVSLPIQSFAERDGTFVNGERRVQRFYTAQGPVGEAIPAWQAIQRLGELLGQGKAKVSAAAVMLDITNNIPAFAGARYKELAHVEQQFPIISKDVFYGGTAYENTGGLGVQIATAADKGDALPSGEKSAAKVQTPKAKSGEMLVVPTTRLYNRERVFQPSELMHARIPEPYVEINSADADRLKIKDGDFVTVKAQSVSVRVRAHVNGGAPAGTVILPRHLTDSAIPLTISVGEVTKG